MKILFINNDGGGFADYIEIAEGTTVSELFQQRIGSGREADYLIRVNRQPVARDQILVEGDRCSFTPTRIEGADAARPAKAIRTQLKQRYQMASAVHDALPTRDAPRQCQSLAIDLWHELVRVVRMRNRAVFIGLHGAEIRLRHRLRRLINQLHQQLEQLSDVIDAAGNQPKPSIIDLLRDVDGLDQEFGSVSWNRKSQTISVKTPEITLEQIDLGAFEIQLQLRYLGQAGSYEVIALNPNPAGTSDDTTHPHVQGQHLCEGEGSRAIKRALADGRLFDFFTIVHQILETYNAGSAYVQLGDWQGIECRDCGGTVDPDDSISCDSCSESICDECSRSCGGCTDSFCDGCVSSCAGCSDDFCGKCLAGCSGCGESFCDDCLNEGTCDDCLETTEEETPETVNTEAAV